jgi:hypothetical protein
VINQLHHRVFKYSLIIHGVRGKDTRSPGIFVAFVCALFAESSYPSQKMPQDQSELQNYVISFKIWFLGLESKYNRPLKAVPRSVWISTEHTKDDLGSK